MKKWTLICIILLWISLLGCSCQQNEFPMIESVVFASTDSISLKGTLYLPPSGKVKRIMIMLTDVKFEIPHPDFSEVEDTIYFIPKIIRNLVNEKTGVLMIGRRVLFERFRTQLFRSQTIQTLADDAENALIYIQSRDDLKHAKIGVFGGSESGCSAAILAARNADVSFLWLYSVPGTDGVSCHDFLSTRGNKGLNEQKYIALLGILESIITNPYFVYDQKRYDKKDIVVNNEGIHLTSSSYCLWDNLEAISHDIIPLYNNYDTIWFHAKKMFEEKWSGTDFVSTDPTDRFSFFRGQKLSASQCVDSLLMWWFSEGDIEFIKWNPQQYYPKITCPVLMLFGGKDVNIPVNESIDKTREMIDRYRKDNFTLKVYPDLDHELIGNFEITFEDKDDKKRKIKTVPNEVYNDVMSWFSGLP